MVGLVTLLIWGATIGPCQAAIDSDDATECRTMGNVSAYSINDNIRYDPDFAGAIRRKNWGLVRGYLLSGQRWPYRLTASQKASLERERISAELIPASARGDRSAILRLLRHGADPSAEALFDDYAFPLAWAARCDHPETVKILLAHGARVNARFSYATTVDGGLVGVTALEWAVESGARRSVAVLLAHGANPRLTSHYESLPDVNGVVYKERDTSTVLDSATDPEVKRMIRKALKVRSAQSTAKRSK